jgi:M6 family metalloprotease-like protein
MKKKCLLVLSLSLLTLVSCQSNSEANSSEETESQTASLSQTSESDGSSESIGSSEVESATSEDIPSSSSESTSSESPTPESSTEPSSQESSSEATESSSEEPFSSISSDSSDEEKITTVVLDENNGQITDNAYDNSPKTSIAGKMPNGESFPVVYESMMKSSDASYNYGQMRSKKKGAGMLRNANPLSNLTSIKVTYKSSSTGKLTYCFSSSSSASTYEEMESGQTYYASGESYFFLKAGVNAIYIKSIEVTFGGSSPAPSTSSSDYSSSSSEASSKEEEWDTNYSSSNVTENYEANKNLKMSDLEYSLSSEGTQNILVLPIEFSDKKFTSGEIEDIKTACSGSADDTGYWESLASYYKKSSYDKLNLQFTYADSYNVGMTAQSFYKEATKSNERSSYAYGSSKAIKKAVEAYKSANGSDATKKFDQNGDGLIDAVIMIYAETYTPSYDEDGSLYWAYQYYDQWDDDLNGLDEGPTPSEESPVGYCYFWASIDFFYEGIGEDEDGVDCHTLIHEFGHILGADDYYNVSAETDTDYEPTGCNTMMAYNILDHDAFNKLQYNWVTPDYVTGSCEVTIGSLEKTGDCIVVADDSGWNGTAFDEYIIIELYTPTGLNELDSQSYYAGGYAKGQSVPGVRMWHVDNRLYKYSYSYSSGEVTEKGWASDSEVSKGDFGAYYASRAISNGTNEYFSDAQNKSFDALTLISPKGKKYSATNASDNNDLFRAGDKFSLLDSSLSSKYSKYFGGKKTFNNGKAFPYQIEVASLSSESATIRFTKAK